MNDNYKTIEHQLRKYSFEFLKVSPEPLNMLEKIHNSNPQMIEDAQKPNLLGAAIIYVYLKRNNLNGRGGITAKSVGEYFGVKAPAISQKAFYVENELYGMARYEQKSEPYEFIDEDRFEVNEMYFDFLESPVQNDIKKSIKALKAMIKKDKNFFDPYITLHEYYLMKRDFKKAIKTMEDAYHRAMDLIEHKGSFPDTLRWGFIENRHIIRMLFNFAMFLWANSEEKKEALRIFTQLLKSNPNDNIGARYSIVAILEGFGSQEEYEEQFESKNGMGLEYEALEKWFYESAQKHMDVIGWWFELDAN